MELLKYRDIAITAIQTRGWQIDFNYTDDATQKTYDRWAIEIVGEVHPFHISANEVNGTYVPEHGLSPGITINSLKAELSKPRGVLIVVAGGVPVLESPRVQGAHGQRYPCDAKNGPIVEFCHVVRQVGLRHFTVHIKFVVHDVPCGNNEPVIANRWAQIENVGDDLCPYRITEGRAILRADVMRARERDSGGAGFNADFLRSTFFFPVPNDYRRQDVSVRLSSDGTTLDYSFIDRGMFLNMGEQNPIIDMKVVSDVGTSMGAPLRPIAQAFQGTQGAVMGVFPNPLAMFGAAMSFPSRMFEAVNANLPRHGIALTVELWGHRSANLSFLARTAFGVAINRVGFVAPALAIGAMEFESQTIIAPKEPTYVRVTVGFRWSDDLNLALTFASIPTIIGPFLGATVAAQGFVAVLARAFFDSDLTIRASNILGQGSIPGNPPQVVLDKSGLIRKNQPFKFGNARGFTDEIVPLVAQLLQDPCAVPATPAVPIPNVAG